MKVTILLPTANRPEMLATAIGSIARQSAVDAVERVVVSENGGNRASEAVCRQFPGLPIQYLFQDPALVPAEHGGRLVRGEMNTPLLAMLCDDDWWAPGHLQTALDALARHPQAIAWFCACSLMASETTTSGELYVPVATRIAAGNPAGTSVWRLSPAQVLAAALVQTPFHVSSMVVQGPALWRAYPVSLTVPPLYADRLVFAALALSGEVLYQPQVSAYVRMHGGSDTAQFGRSVRRAGQPEAQRRVEELARDVGVDLRAAWGQVVDRLTPEFRGSFFDIVNYSLGFRGARRYGLASVFSVNPVAWQFRRVVRKWQNVTRRR